MPQPLRSRKGCALEAAQDRSYMCVYIYIYIYRYDSLPMDMCLYLFVITIATNNYIYNTK